MTAGSSFVGQFIDHDVTFDQTSMLGVPQDPLRSPNTRTPALDLDSVFGGGPALRPDLYVRNHDGSVGPQLAIGSGGPHEDLPRIANGDGTYDTVIADLRNDEHLMIIGLQCAHILFYNRVLAELSEWDLSQFPQARDDGGHSGRLGERPGDGGSRYRAYRVARQVTQWHYQWLAINEHLVQLVGREMVYDVLAHGSRFYRSPHHDAYVPIEFSAAAYRVGHSMVRPSYRANFTSGTGDSTDPTADPFFGLVFDPNEPGFSGQPDHDRGDLLGGYPAPRRYIGWQTFFDFGEGQVKNNKKIDTSISTVMFDLPIPAIPRTPRRRRHRCLSATFYASSPGAYRQGRL
ncbi:MAG: hypothetical protein KGQ66_08820 [Acidobacteriota bacterium]|nr:hypothetical protein [Acidobacteriota bacterium]